MEKYLTTEEWRKFGEVQYLKGRLDEQYKLISELELDLHSGRVIDARISKYFTKLRQLDPMAYELYRIERDNINHINKRNEKSKKTS